MILQKNTISCRIDFKICLIVFKIVNNCAPQYLINMLTLYKPVRNLRSSHDQTQLVVPRFNLSLSGQCFSIYAPKVWNELLHQSGKLHQLLHLKISLKPISFVNCY